MPVNVCLGVGGYMWVGTLIGMSLLHGLCMCEGESDWEKVERDLSHQQLNERAGVRVCLPGP